MRSLAVVGVGLRPARVDGGNDGGFGKAFMCCCRRTTVFGVPVGRGLPVCRDFSVSSDYSCRSFSSVRTPIIQRSPELEPGLPIMTNSLGRPRA